MSTAEPLEECEYGHSEGTLAAVNHGSENFANLGKLPFGNSDSCEL